MQAIPVAHTMSGKGGIPCTHPLSVGLFGRYARIANELIDASDCLVVVGCKLGEIATKRYAIPAPHIPVIHLEIVAEEIGRCHAAEVALWGDARAGLEDLAEALAGDAAQARRARADYVAEIPRRMQAWEEEASPRLNSRDRPVHMARLCRELNRALPADAILVADGGFNMMLGELETARRAGLGLTIVVVNNAASGYVKALQHAMMGGRYQSADLSEMDYAAIARAMGVGGIRVEDPEQLGAALAQGMAERDRPTVVDVVVTRDPGQMLPAVDNRTVEIRQGDRVA